MRIIHDSAILLSGPGHRRRTRRLPKASSALIKKQQDRRLSHTTLERKVIDVRFFVLKTTAVKQSLVPGPLTTNLRLKKGQP